MSADEKRTLRERIAVALWEDDFRCDPQDFYALAEATDDDRERYYGYADVVLDLLGGEDRTACGFCHGSRGRDLREALERLTTNHRVLAEDADVMGNHTPSDCATCVFLARQSDESC